MIGLNNPFNIRYSKGNNWIGQIGNNRGFCVFESVNYAIRAAAILIMRSYRKKDVLTISEIINRYAPSSENNTSAYVDFICQNMGIFPFDIPNSKSEYYLLLHYISVYEVSACCVTVEHIRQVCEYFGIVPYKLKKK